MLKRLAAFGLMLLATPALAGAPPSGKLVSGQPFSIGDAPVTIVHYWASWCAPCRTEMPKLDAYYRAHHARGVALVAISLDQGGEDKVKRAMAGMAMPLARIDAVKMARRDIPTALPVTRVYDRAGRLRYDSAASGGEGLINFAKLDQAVTAVLSEPALGR